MLTRLVPSLSVFGSRLNTVTYSSSPGLNWPRPPVSRIFLGVEDVVEVRVVAVEHARVRAAVDEFEFGRRLERRALDRVRSTRCCCRRWKCPAFAARRRWPARDRRHAGQVEEHVDAGGIEVELGRLVHQPERGRVHRIARPRHADEPEKRVAHGHGGVLVRRRVGEHAGRGRVDVAQHDFRVLFRAVDGGLGLASGERVVLPAVGHEHGVAEDQREAHQPQTDHEHDDQHAAAPTRIETGKNDARGSSGGAAARRWVAVRRRAVHPGAGPTTGDRLATTPGRVAAWDATGSCDALGVGVGVA